MSPLDNVTYSVCAASYLWLNNAQPGGQIANAKRSFVGVFYVAFMFRKYISVFILVYFAINFEQIVNKLFS